MKQYRLGEKVRLAAGCDRRGRPIPAVYRAEVMRPDGKLIERDWDKHEMRLKADRVGVWSWRMYLREDGSTRIQTGQFEVLAPDYLSLPAVGGKGLLRRLLRRR